VTLAKSFSSSPYFLRCYYDELWMKYRSEGCRIAVLIGLRRLNDVVVGASSMLGGIVLGKISLSRSTLTADIYLYMFLTSGEIVVMAQHCIGFLKTSSRNEAHMSE